MLHLFTSKQQIVFFWVFFLFGSVIPTGELLWKQLQGLISTILKLLCSVFLSSLFSSRLPRRQGSILYCTTGIILQWLRSDPWVPPRSQQFPLRFSSSCPLLCHVLVELCRGRPHTLQNKNTQLLSTRHCVPILLFSVLSVNHCPSDGASFSCRDFCALLKVGPVKWMIWG